MAEVRNQSESDDVSGMSRTSHSGIDDPQDGLDLTSPPIVITDDLTRSTLPPIERVRFRIAVGVLIGFAAFIAIPLVVLFIVVFTTENRVKVDDIVRVVTTLSATTSGLMGAVVGYYFGQNSNI